MYYFRFNDNIVSVLDIIIIAFILDRTIIIVSVLDRIIILVSILDKNNYCMLTSCCNKMTLKVGVGFETTVFHCHYNNKSNQLGTQQ